MNLKGKTINDILNTSWEDLKKLDRNELAKLTGRLVSAGNKRLRYLKNSKTIKGEYAPAYQTIMKKGVFSVKGKSRNEILKEYNRLQTFFNYKTNTVKKFKKVEKETEKRIGKMTERQKKEYWKTYRKLEENGLIRTLNNQYGSTQVQQMLREEYINKKTSKKKAINKVLERARVIYEEQQKQERRDETTSTSIYSQFKNFDN